MNAEEEQAWHIQVSGVVGMGGWPQDGDVMEMGDVFSLEAGELHRPSGRIK